MTSRAAPRFVCPRDGAALALLKERGRVCHQCPECRGYAITVPLLRRIVPRAVANEIWNEARGGAVAEEGCPGCRASMRRATVARADGQGEIEVAVCPQCQWVWLDAGEIDAVPRQVETAEQELSPAARAAMAAIEQESSVERREWKSGRWTGHGEPPPDFDTWWEWIPWVLGLPVETGPGAARRSFPFALAALSLVIATASLTVLLSFPAAERSEFFRRWGFTPVGWDAQGGLTLLTAFFFHASWLHLIGNLYFLALAGDDVEDRLGPGGFLLLLLVATLAGHAAHWLGQPDSTIPAIGASGGISGILVYWALAFPRKRVHVRLWYGAVAGNMTFRARTALVLWILAQILIAALQLAGLSAVSGLAHIGGAAVGLGAFFAADRFIARGST